MARSGGDALVSWKADVLALDYRVFRSADPSEAGSFQDVSAEDGDTTDNRFLDTSGGSLAAFIVTAVGPDGEGPWGHFGN